MQNFMFKCSELVQNFTKKNNYLMVKKVKNYFLPFLYGKCVCVTVLKRFLKSLPSYGKYMEFLSGFQLIIIDISRPNPKTFKILNFVLEK